MKHLFISAALILALSACGGGQVAITGSLRAVQGGNLQGTVLAICPVQGNQFNCSPAAGAKQINIPAAGTSATFDVKVNPGSYAVLALKDLDGNGDFSTGDQAAAYRDVNDIQAVQAPAANIALVMKVITLQGQAQGLSGLESHSLR
jgi:uncharacterized protein (DUF2141 family)